MSEEERIKTSAVFGGFAFIVIVALALAHAKAGAQDSQPTPVDLQAQLNQLAEDNQLRWKSIRGLSFSPQANQAQLVSPTNGEPDVDPSPIPDVFSQRPSALDDAKVQITPRKTE